MLDLEVEVRGLLDAGGLIGHGPHLELCTPEVTFETSTVWRMAATDTPAAGWHDVGFDDSAFANAVNVNDPSDGWFEDGSSRWIWDAQGDQASGDAVSFRREFSIDAVPSDAAVVVAADNGCEVYINGTLVASHGSAQGVDSSTADAYADTTTYPISTVLFVPGLNCMSIIGWNETAGNPGPAGVYAVLRMNRTAGSGDRASACGHGHHAREVLYDATDSGLDADNAQEAIDELAANSGGVLRGTLTPSGSPLTVFDESSGRHYYGFPSLIQTWDGFWHCFAQKKNDHTDSALTGTGVRKSAATIGALPAAMEVEVLAAPIPGSIGIGGPFVTVLADDRVVASYETLDGTLTLAGRIPYFEIGSWDGTEFSWSLPTQITDHGFSSFVVLSPSGIVELPSGRWLRTVYGSSDADVTRQSKLLYSDDEGDSWAVLSTIASAVGKKYDEPIIAPPLPDGTLHCMIREAVSGEMLSTESTDEGLTWSTPVARFDGQSQPEHVRLLSGLWLYVGRADPDGDTMFRTRTDDDPAWTDETILDATGTRNLYASIKQAAPATIYAAYGLENSTTDGAVLIETFTDTSSGYSFHDALARVTPDQHHSQAHDIEGLDHWTVETDTSLRLGPDGLGGVAFHDGAPEDHDHLHRLVVLHDFGTGLEPVTDVNGYWLYGAFPGPQY